MERRIATPDLAELWTTVEGSGPGLVLSSGGPGCCDYLAPVSEPIQDVATVVRWEQRGCGRSTADGRYDLATAIEDLETIREAVGWKRWTVGGHSWGANLSLAYALEHPDRTSSVLYLAGNGAQDDRAWHAAYEEGRSRGDLLPRFEFPFNPDVNKAGNQTWREYFRDPDFLKRVSGLDMPILFVGGGLEEHLWWPAEQLYRLVPNGERHLIEGAPHHMEMTHPNELATLLKGFLLRTDMPNMDGS